MGDCADGVPTFQQQLDRVTSRHPPVAPVTKVLARLILSLLFRRTPSRSASESTVTRVGGSHIHAVKAARCLLMNSSSVVGGRPPIFSTRSFVPAKIPF